MSGIRIGLRDEAFDPRRGLAEHTERAVSGSRDLDRQLNDAFEHRLEVEFRGEGQSGIDEQRVSVDLPFRLSHARSLANARGGRDLSS
jgi:hypothetical protein